MIVWADAFTQTPIEALSHGDEVMTLEGMSRVDGVVSEHVPCVRVVGGGIDQVQPYRHEVLTVDGWRSYAMLADESRYYGGAEDYPSVRVYLKLAARVPYAQTKTMRVIDPAIWGSFTTEVAAADVRRSERLYRHPYRGEDVPCAWESFLALCEISCIGNRTVHEISVAVANHYITAHGVLNKNRRLGS